MGRKPTRSHGSQHIPHAHQFLVVLGKTDPLVWRRVQVPGEYSFWDLHVAIQDAMGWRDDHLHDFQVVNPSSGELEHIGIPDDDFPDERPCIAGWKASVSDYFSPNLDLCSAFYVYDFGDHWQHLILHEGTWPTDPSVRYPRCISGARACPPEDCGGVHGYTEFLAAIADAAHPEHQQWLQWVGGSFDPDAFDPAQVSFDDPKKRWNQAFRK